MAASRCPRSFVSHWPFFPPSIFSFFWTSDHLSCLLPYLFWDKTCENQRLTWLFVRVSASWGQNFKSQAPRFTPRNAPGQARNTEKQVCVSTFPSVWTGSFPGTSPALLALRRTEPPATAAPPAHRSSFIKAAPRSGAARAGLGGTRGEPPGEGPRRGTPPAPSPRAAPPGSVRQGDRSRRSPPFPVPTAVGRRRSRATRWGRCGAATSSPPAPARREARREGGFSQVTINRVASGRPCGRVSAGRASPCSGPERLREPVVWGERLGHPGHHGGPPCSSGPGSTYGMCGTIYGVELERDPRATGSCPLLPQGGLTWVTPLLNTRECCCISHFIARLFANPAPLMVLVSRLCLPMASVHQLIKCVL